MHERGNRDIDMEVVMADTAMATLQRRPQRGCCDPGPPSRPQPMGKQNIHMPETIEICKTTRERENKEKVRRGANFQTNT
jgi:hypothetical protein